MTVDYAQVSKNFSLAAARYDTLAIHQNSWMQEAIEEALRVFPAHGLVLDSGCGTGAFAAMAKAKRDWRISGLDIAPGMLDVAATRCDTVVQASMESLPFAGGVFNGIFSSLAIQWVNDLPRAMTEMARVLAPNAAAVVVSLGEKNLQELTALAHEMIIETLPMRSRAEYEKAAHEAGFRMIQSRESWVRVTYENARTFLHSMRDIGAGNAQKNQNKQELREKMATLVTRYEARHGCAEGVYAHWQPVFLTMVKL